MTFAKIDKRLVETNSTNIIESSRSEITQLEDQIQHLKQNAAQRYEELSRLGKFFNQKHEFIQDLILFDMLDLNVKIDSLKRQIKNARGLLMLAKQSTDNVVYLSPSDARFLNIDPTV